MIRLVAVGVLAFAIGFGTRDVVTTAPAAARTVVAGEAEVTLNAPGLL